MATGQLQGGGVFSWPDVPTLGIQTWAGMSGMTPGHPLVGGSGPGSQNGVTGARSVAIAQPPPTQGAVAGAPGSQNWRELFNLKGNPTGWVLIAAILYLGLMHLHVRGGADFGVGKGRR
jgi:hypothetical protein